jgi:DNA-binding LacI/PurR family transcriptional regulator
VPATGSDNDRPPDARKRVGILDVAKAAGVSRTTASDALNGRGRVEETTRLRVVETALALGYRANPHARMLRSGGSGIIAFVSSLPGGMSGELASLEYYMGLMMGAATRAMAGGYAVVLLPLEPHPGDVDAVHADGALLFDPVSESSLLPRLERGRVATVSTGRRPDRPYDDGWWVDNDIAGATRQMLDLLEQRGARLPALVSNPPTRSYSIDTIETYRAWMAERGLEPRIALTGPLATESTAYHAALDLFDHDPPDAVYAPLDRLAVGAMLAARTRGLTVPADLMVAAGSDSETARSATPGITALDLKPERIGQIAVDLLIERLGNGDTGGHHVLVDAEIRERASTRA